MLTILTHLPNQLLDMEAHQLHSILAGPTLIHLEGRRKETLFVSVLLHGNENSGFLAIKGLLKKYSNKELPRSLALFIGNVEAARYHRRHLDQQPDYNRIWLMGNSEEHKMIQNLIETMKQYPIFASVDIHNNTGLNPHYACVTELDRKSLHLATLFSKTVVYFNKPEGTQTKAFSKFCPSITVECGQPGQTHGVEHALKFLDACLHLDHFPDTLVHQQDLELFHTVAVIKVPNGINFGFDPDTVGIRFRQDLDHLNFIVLPPYTELAYINSKENVYLEAMDEKGNNVSDKYFSQIGNAICTKQEVMPSMLTLNTDVIRQDCLCYFMERYSLV